MSYADRVFIDMCRDIIDNGTSTEGEKVRPVWDGVLKKMQGFDFTKFKPVLIRSRSLVW